MGHLSLRRKAATAAQPIIHIVLGTIGFIVIFAPALALEMATGWLVAEKIINPLLLTVAVILRWGFVIGDVLIFGSFLIAGVFLFLVRPPVIETASDFWRHVGQDMELMAEILVECLSGFVVVVVFFGLAIGLDLVVGFASHLPGVGHGLATFAKYVKIAILVIDVVLAAAFLYNQVTKFLQRIWIHLEKHLTDGSHH